MLTTVLFDMGGTLEDIWYNEDTQRATCRRLLEVLRANGLEPGCPDDVFWKRITDGVKAYKQWSEGNMLEKKPEEIWPDWYLRDFAFDREKLLPITEELANLWEVTFYHREPHPEIFRIALRQMQAKPEMCVYVGDTVSRDIIGPKQVGFAKAVQIRSFLSEQKDVHVAADAAQPDKVIGTLMDLVTWLDQINPELAPAPGA